MNKMTMSESCVVLITTAGKGSADESAVAMAELTQNDGVTRAIAGQFDP